LNNQNSSVIITYHKLDGYNIFHQARKLKSS